MIEMYQEELEKQKRFLKIIQKTMEELNRIYGNSKNSKKIEEQLNSFYIYLQSEKTRDIDIYNKQTRKNISKIDDKVSYQITSQIESVLKDFDNDFTYEEINTMLAIISRQNTLSSVINNLSNYYISTINKINQIERTIEQLNEKTELEEQEDVYSKEELENIEAKKHKETEEISQTSNLQWNNPIIEANANAIINGPKQKSFLDKIQGKDLDINDMQYLYGLAMDILVLMEYDQQVSVHNISTENKQLIEDASFPYVTELSSKSQQIYSKYGVTTIEGLIAKYGNIRNAYFNNFSKLKTTQQTNYEFSKFNLNGIKFSLDNYAEYTDLYNAIQNENFKFPPSSEELKSLINRRILNGKNFELIEPRPTENIAEAEPLSYEEHTRVQHYYRNLVKNMNEQEIAKLYSRVVNDLKSRQSYLDQNEKVIEEYYVIIQKMFCELLIEKQGKKFLDPKQHKEELMKIAQQILNEQVKFTVYGHDQATIEEHQERKQTIYSEYIKYLASQENKQTAMKFSEYAQSKYGLENSAELEKYYNQQAEREGRSR